MQKKIEKAERLIPVTDSVHAELSEIKGRERLTFNQLIKKLIGIYKNRKENKEIEYDREQK